MQDRWRVRLPVAVRPPFEVYVNGVLQREGTDFEHRNGALLFDRPLVKEGRLGLWRWFLGAWGIGTYRHNDTVDIAYRAGGRPLVAHALDIEPPGATRSARAAEHPHERPNRPPRRKSHGPNCR